jgi:thiamine biosynthesis lipoprotein
MATRFEVVLYGTHEVVLRAAAEAALDEIERLEAQLSRYRDTSEVRALNTRAAAGPVQVEPQLFRLLQRAEQLHRHTQGAFDITVGPLVRCWGFGQNRGRVPTPEALDAARQMVGMHLVELDPRQFTVRFTRPGVSLDLGAIGKGYAIDRAVELLLDAGITCGLVHGGTSSVYALGSPTDAEHWIIALPRPGAYEAQGPLAALPPDVRPVEPLALVPLRDASVSVSAIWGRAFEADGRVYGHVLDPRRGEPVRGAVMAAVVTPSATDADALSTALLVLGADGIDQLRAAPVAWRGLLVERDPAGAFVITRHAL